LNGQKLQALDGWDEVSLFQELQKFMKKHEVISFEIFLVPDVKEFSHETHGQKYYKYWWRCWVIYKEGNKK
jgi:hypothetical protein